MKDVQIYENKTLSELLKQIIKNCENEKTQALEMYDAIKGECTTPEQMMLIGPVAANYLEIVSKQTDNLIKLANAIQKFETLDRAGTDDTHLSELERAELFSHLEQHSIDPISARQTKTKKNKQKKVQQAADGMFALNIGKE